MEWGGGWSWIWIILGMIILAILLGLPILLLIGFALGMAFDSYWKKLLAEFDFNFGDTPA